MENNERWQATGHDDKQTAGQEHPNNPFKDAEGPVVDTPPSEEADAEQQRKEALTERD